MNVIKKGQQDAALANGLATLKYAHARASPCPLPTPLPFSFSFSNILAHLARGQSTYRWSCNPQSANAFAAGCCGTRGGNEGEERGVGQLTIPRQEAYGNPSREKGSARQQNEFEGSEAAQAAPRAQPEKMQFAAAHLVSDK